MATAAVHTERSSAGTRAVPRFAGAVPLLGHMAKFARDPVAMMQAVREACGPVGEFRMLNKRVVLLSGPAAQEAFCRAPDEQLSQKIAYRMMTPVFGEGVVFDAPPERLNEQLRILMPALRDRNMRTYADVFTEEVGAMVRGWGEAGEFDLLDFTAELTTYTSSHCLLGSEFRRSMNEEFARVYGDLEKGVNAIAYVNPYLPLPVFRRRDRARARLLQMITAIIDQRRASGSAAQDALQVLMESRYSDGTPLTPNEITGILTASMFAGHHTSSGTEAWTIIELARHPAWAERVVAELDALYARDGGLTYQAFREVPILESVLKEVLRLHPPLVILMRGVLQDFTVEGVTIPAGKLVAISPAVSHRMPELFRDPTRFDPSRYDPGRAEDATPFAWIAFGGGHHRCSGAAFAIMQLKAITMSLLRRFTFALVDPPDSYGPDYTKMVVQVRQPCRVRYRRRADAESSRAAAVAAPGAAAQSTSTVRVRVDLGLCQGHGVCVSEAPEVFRLNAQQTAVELLHAEAPDALRDRVAAAVRHCPTHALTIEDA